MNGHFGNFLPLILVVLYGVFARSRAAAKKARPPAPAAPPQAGAMAEDPDRTRRVREEVRRKIAERRRAAAALPPLTAAPETPPPVVQTADFDRMTDANADAERDMLEQQQLLAKKISALDEDRRAAPAPAPLYSARPPLLAPIPEVSPNAWLLELRDPKLARRAIVLREVLGAPVGLR